ncbi:cytochrome-c oxidase, cbb3-type subunit III [Citreimonas salinaria]|uniref:Cbb3-type cytochrome c oxidase subunit n=1 Tax=Citreimonas salinaria TaxID=321339 RepID=A0A1H3NZS8_9RHOB|nr:cytochrome-c oxidase, cbb3-type subunit III [Citreimonas salinaria]SDY94270.1 cytochrome c oxidase cbb3-type subunit 3 [Citreimonas salinaria]
MSVEDERDELTGHKTTGHDWNGIKELNTRVPRAVWWAIGITHVWALIMWILLPAWPLVDTYTKGVLGVNQQELVEGELAAGERYREHWEAHLTVASLDEIRSEQALMDVVRASAPTLWGDNCSACHGIAGIGGPGFPNLIDDAWLWGGDDQAVLEAIRVGINAGHPETLVSQMLAFGEMGILSRDEIRTVGEYVRALGGLAEPEPAVMEEGAMLYADNCASCHADDGTGMNALGAPNLTDEFWIYGGDPQSVFRTIHDGRQGWMPAWEGRLSEAQAKILAIYLLDILPEAE